MTGQVRTNNRRTTGANIAKIRKTNIVLLEVADEVKLLVAIEQITWGSGLSTEIPILV